jgi:APA family basic amino acid/polyamine antiporter
MAADGLLWKPLARLDPARGTPARALWVQAVLSCVWLGFAGGFEDVSGWFVTTSWLFYGVTTAALFVQRRREAAGQIEAPAYRTPLYPLTPALFILATTAIIVSDLTSTGVRAWAGVGITALGFPVYFVWKGHRTVA